MPLPQRGGIYGRSDPATTEITTMTTDIISRLADALSCLLADADDARGAQQGMVTPHPDAREFLVLLEVQEIHHG